ncbi:MAG: KH domain-containing protein [Candidatus Bathyarchaeia archaeon]
MKIPKDRIGVLIGPEGKVKEEIERRLRVKIRVDSEEGDVSIGLPPENDDPSTVFRAKEVVLSIGRGFSPEKAFNLLEDEDAFLEIIDLREFVGRSSSEVNRVKGRVIGKEGKMRKVIEELTETFISVYGHTVSIIGRMENVQVAKEAITMLINGSEHSTVNRFLDRKRRELKSKALELWERPKR